jgi:hypothetical protein
MRPRVFHALCAALLAVACSKPTLSSFEGSITMQTALAGGPPQQMVVKAKGDKLRFDVVGAGGPTHAVYDPTVGKVMFFIDPDRKYVDLDFSPPTMAPNTDPGSSAIVRSGTHRKVAGYDCEQVSVTDAAGKRTEVCIAQGIAYFDVNGLRPGVQKDESPMAREFRLHRSFPLESVEYAADGKELSHMKVTKIEREKLEDAQFAIPKEYDKIELPPVH